LNTKDVIVILSSLLEKKEFIKPAKYPNFSQKEARLLVDLIFFKPKDLLWRFILEEAFGDSSFGRMAFNGPSVRKVKFLHHLIETRFNGAAAARLAGFCHPKQAAYRLRKELACSL